jgi:hypothetical protein
VRLRFALLRPRHVQLLRESFPSLLGISPAQVIDHDTSWARRSWVRGTVFSPSPAGRPVRQPPIGVVRRPEPGAAELRLSGGRDARFGGKQSRAEGPAGRVVFVQSGVNEHEPVPLPWAYPPPNVLGAATSDARRTMVTTSSRLTLFCIIRNPRPR